MSESIDPVKAIQEKRLIINTKREAALAKLKENGLLQSERHCSLSEKQKRILSNKEKALEILKAKRLCKSSVALVANGNEGKRAKDNTLENGQVAANQNKVNHDSSHQPQATNLNCNLKSGIPTQDSLGKKDTSKTEYNENQKNSSNGMEAFGKNIKTTSAVCTLKSADRFVVQCGYHQQLQEIFQAIPSKAYDMKSRNWNFKLEDHDKLQELVRPLHPEVTLGKIPVFVSRILNACSKKVDASDLQVISPKLLDALLPFQLEGVRFGISNGGRVLIADDMGLGKTIQAIALADFYSSDWPVLCVAPSSVRYSWLHAFQNWLPHLQADHVQTLSTGKEKISKASKIVIISYDLLAKNYKMFASHKFQFIIMDESHFMKNVKSARTQAAREVAKFSRRLILLSGTPALSRPSELYPQLNLLDSKLFNNFTEFGIRYCNGKKVPWGNGWDFKGSSNMKELSIVLKKNMMIRRLKSNVMHQLPSKQRSMVLLDPSMVSLKTEKMETASKTMFKKSLKGTEKHGALLKYFSESAHAKLKAVCNYIEDLLECDDKFICFAHHQVMLNAVCNLLNEKDISYIRIDGRTGSEVRKEMCDAFQTEDYRVAVLSITAANAGITLTAAHLVVFAELFWNPGILTQAEDRVHRIGQQNLVNIQYLVARGTADDFLWPLVQQKLDVLNEAGLSKDNFSDAATKVTEEKCNQKKITEFLKDIEEDMLADENFG